MSARGTRDRVSDRLDHCLPPKVRERRAYGVGPDDDFRPDVVRGERATGPSEPTDHTDGKVEPVRIATVGSLQASASSPAGCLPEQIELVGGQGIYLAPRSSASRAEETTLRRSPTSITGMRPRRAASYDALRPRRRNRPASGIVSTAGPQSSSSVVPRPSVMVPIIPPSSGVSYLCAVSATVSLVQRRPPCYCPIRI